MNTIFIINVALLGIGLAMDAFSVSITNGMVYRNMKIRHHLAIAGTFGFFQFLMPLVGWFCVTRIADHFRWFQQYIPWIALLLLCYIGAGMIGESRKKDQKDSIGQQESAVSPAPGILLMQGIATAIDALSVGFTISNYSAQLAFFAAGMIGIITFLICMAGIRIGMLFGDIVKGRAMLIGGLILIGIGIEIFIRNL